MKVLQIDSQPMTLFLVTTMIYVWYITLFAFFGLVSSMAFDGLRNNLKNDDIGTAILCLSTLAYQFYCVGSFVVLFAVYQRLKLINQYLEKLSRFRMMREKEILKNLRTVAIFVDKICEALESIKRTFAVNTVIFLFQLVGFAISCYYSLICYFLIPKADAFDLAFVVMVWLWTMFYSPFVFLVFLLGPLINREGIKFETNIQNLLYKNDDRRIYKTAQLIHLQLLHRKPEVSCGVFKIDLKLFFYFTVFNFSYVIILVQFEFQ